MERPLDNELGQGADATLLDDSPPRDGDLPARKLYEPPMVMEHGPVSSLTHERVFNFS